MTENLFTQMDAAIADLQPTRDVGRVLGAASGTVQIGGMSQRTRVGDRAQIHAGQSRIKGEVVRLDAQVVHLLVEGSADGISLGDRVVFDLQRKFAPDASWVGRVMDPDGQPLDGRPLLPGLVPRNVRATPPAAHERRAMGPRLETGLAVFNTLLPLVQGQRIGLFAGSGVGKSTLLADLARGVTADVIVIALVGERGREVRHFVQDVLGPSGMERAIVVAATSDRAPQVRRSCAWAAMAVAEHFRDEGKQVLLLIDSITRFCEAHREVAVAAGENANLRGYPASTGPAIAALCERAGPGVEGAGDITAIFSVLVAGSDMEEPIADMLRGVLDGHVVLDRGIAERGRFPAIDILRSVSRSLPDAATPQENKFISQARTLLGAYDRAELMIQAGLYASGSDPNIDAAIACAPTLDEFLTIKDSRGSLAHFAKLRQAMATSGGLMKTEERG
ncbi:FliI/YscN family ATPase [Yoonia sediminilitoris]|uniref:Flagellum-specific ATP synthase n=1 Tax=Yoonia sediminilitoris TaxID=1286148 RepID=A0A2T6KAF6_9RHOB|nr:FliI/YscN family ATPase [Yoonia sediminilitoris]PUB11784.1 flagellum-specific ATP synthase [Yoonia sediminilitoris]RCW91861.1 flagellum-specific ATP synthase [Yoonia sediminilitoris]